MNPLGVQNMTHKIQELILNFVDNIWPFQCCWAVGRASVRAPASTDFCHMSEKDHNDAPTLSQKFKSWTILPETGHPVKRKEIK